MFDITIQFYLNSSIPGPYFLLVCALLTLYSDRHLHHQPSPPGCSRAPGHVLLQARDAARARGSRLGTLHWSVGCFVSILCLYCVYIVSILCLYCVLCRGLSGAEQGVLCLVCLWRGVSCDCDWRLSAHASGGMRLYVCMGRVRACRARRVSCCTPITFCQLHCRFFGFLRSIVTICWVPTLTSTLAAAFLRGGVHHAPIRLKGGNCTLCL